MNSSSTTIVKFINTFEDTVNVIGIDADICILIIAIDVEILPNCWFDGVCISIDSTALSLLLKFKLLPLPKLINEIVSVLGSRGRTKLATVLPVFVILNSNTLDLPRIILELTEDG